MKKSILVIGLLISILFTSIVYSSFNTSLQVSGEAVVRSIQNIRIDDVRLTNHTTGTYETYSSKYTKDTTSLFVTLPANTSMTYEVDITNKNSGDYLIDSIEELSNTNSNVVVTKTLNVNDIINGNSVKTFTITITNNTESTEEETLVYKYVFRENLFTVTFDANGGSVSQSSKQVSYGSTYGTLPTPTRSGYAFKGWKTVENLIPTNLDYWEIGAIQDANGKNSDRTERVRLKDFLPVSPNNEYRITTTNNVNIRLRRVWFYDANKKFIESVGWNTSNYSFTTPSNCAYIRTVLQYSDQATVMSLSDVTTSGVYLEAIVNKNSIVTYAGNHTLEATWEVKQNLTINPNGGTYNSSSSNTLVQQINGSYYGLGTPTRNGYTFAGWQLTGTGTMVNGNAQALAAATAHFEKVDMVDTDGSVYTKYKYENLSPSSVLYPNVKYSAYAFEVGHTYRISVEIRVNRATDVRNMNIRHAAWYNDYNSTGYVRTTIDQDAVGAGWILYTMERTYNSTTLTYSGGTDEREISPCFEIYSQVDGGHTGTFEFDIRNLIIEDVTAGTYIASDTYGGYIYKFGNSSATLTAKWKTVLVDNKVNYDYTGSAQEFVAPETGTYKVELWGAQGGPDTGKDYGGYGGYTSGLIDLTEGTSLYLYVGDFGYEPENLAKPFNGGGAPDITGTWTASHTGMWSGGGATDIRTVNGEWDNFESLKSRIMVAGGGGGGNNGDGSPGGCGGGLNGGETYNGSNTSAIVTAPTQTSGYRFGYGQGSGVYNTDGGADTGAGGGGYYGGFRGLSTNSGGSGGSSYISGHAGSNSISSTSTSASITHTDSPNHYSGYVFSSTQMIDGKGCVWTSTITSDCSGQPQPDGTTATGHIGDGYARITFVG